MGIFSVVRANHSLTVTLRKEGEVVWLESPNGLGAARSCRPPRGGVNTIFCNTGGIRNTATGPPGNGVLLWFEIDDIDAAIARAEAMGVEVIMPRHRNPPDGDGGPNHWEFWLRDLDGYKVVLASPDGTADGDWQP